ncbi:MAG TPA: adenylate/guanylate cyclase domain-containing protein [Mycobacteriales bacterium]|nr:adenylate/guanylate cyclase domain-containing protein [Mycobacteriales bacterium]
MDRPATRYVSVGDADVAYQVVGEGSIDLLYFYGLGSHVEGWWDDPDTAEFFRRLASFSRLILFDRRGTGASDAVPQSAIPTWEEWAEDIGAVLDAVDSRHAAIIATIDAGPIAILYAVAHPERVSALVLVNTAARYMTADDYPVGASPEDVDAFLELFRTAWGTPEFVAVPNPGLTDDPERMEWAARLLRLSATPRMATAQYEYMLRSVDVRPVLSVIQAPTLVLHVHDNPSVPIEHGRFLAQNIEGAQFVELPGRDILITREMYPLVDEVARFLTGRRQPIQVERVLTTLMFSDIVDSTSRAAQLGDHDWRSLLDRHDQAVRSQIARAAGREVNTTGDGFLASFDGPARAIRCAFDMIEETRRLGVPIRVGVHTGECEVRGEDLAGLAVHIAARVAAAALPGEVLVSSTVKELVIGSGIEFDSRGQHELKGVPGAWSLFAAQS